MRLRRATLAAALAATGIVVAVPQVPAGAAVPSQVLTTGSNAFGQLGSPASSGRTSPAANAVANAVQIASGRDHAYALDDSGRVWGWGENGYGQVGNGSTTDQRSPVQLSLTQITQIDAGHYHGMALRSDGTVWTWGYGALGQLGLGTTNNRTTPVQVPGLANVVDIAGGRDMSYAVLADGRVMAWGNNSLGEVGDGTNTRRTSPVTVSGLSGVVDIGAGRNHGLAVDSSGRLRTWGDNTYGQLGDGTTTQRRTPVLLSLGSVARVDAGAHHSVAVTTGGQLYTFGRGYRGQIGNGSTANRTTPTLITGLPAVHEVGDGRDQTYAVTTTGSVYAWGYNAAGQLGDGTTTQRSRPVLLGLTGVTAVQGGSSHAVFLRTTGPVENQPPQARFTSSCSALACTFDARGSTDPDGQIVATSWAYGDGDTGTGATSQHTFGQPGSYQVTVTVTDDDGATAQSTAQVQVTSDPPPTTPIAFVGSRAASANASSVTVTDPAGVQSGQVKILIVTANRSDTTLSASGWTAGATVTDESMRTQAWYRVSGGGPTSTTITATAAAKLDAHLLVYSGVSTAQPLVNLAFAPETGSSSAHVTPVVANVPSGAWAVSYWADKSATTTGWTPPGGVSQRQLSVGSGSGRIAALSADSGGPVAGPAAGGLTAVASAPNSKAVMGTVVLRPAF